MVFLCANFGHLVIYQDVYYNNKNKQCIFIVPEPPGKAMCTYMKVNKGAGVTRRLDVVLSSSASRFG